MLHQLWARVTARGLVPRCNDAVNVMISALFFMASLQCSGDVAAFIGGTAIAISHSNGREKL
jgi:hypothetical protein